ncbi:MAG TPA: hypothetical protein ENN60_02550 [archaeon]|nr:hypothetical protein [archaeon]
MRYMKIEWLKDEPNSKTLVAYIRHMFGELGLVESGFKVFQGEGLVGCETPWLEKIRGALALKWQFKVTNVSGTRKHARQ